MTFISLRSVILFSVLAACCVACAWMFWPRPIVSLPRLSAAEISALGDSPADRHALFVHLSAVLLGRGQQLGPWQQLPHEAQPVWTTLYVETCIDGRDGLRSFLPPEPGVVVATTPSASPTLDDAATGYRAMGSNELADCLDRCARSLAAQRRAPGDFAKQYQPLIAAARASRVAYQRQHVTALNP